MPAAIGPSPMPIAVRSTVIRYPGPIAVPVISGFYPVAVVRGQPRIENVIILLIRFRNLLALAAPLRFRLRLNNRLSLTLRQRYAARLRLITATFWNGDECCRQIIRRCSISNDQSVVVNAISDIQRTESCVG